MNEEFAASVERVNFGHKIMINWIVIKMSLNRGLVTDIATDTQIGSRFTQAINFTNDKPKDSLSGVKSPSRVTHNLSLRHLLI